MRAVPEVLRSSYPKSAGDIYYKITEYGQFIEQLDCVVEFITSTFEDGGGASDGQSSTMVIRGQAGCGKSTLADRAIRRHISRSKFKTYAIKLNGYLNTSDESTIQLMAKTLGITSTKINDIIDDIVESPDLRLIVILDEFEQFCRRQQTLLYNLFHLNQHAQHVCIICLIQDMDCMDLLEKRVKSRFTYRPMKMSYPYTNRSEYLEFASQLLGDYPIQGNLAEDLMDFYTRDESIRGLKRFLASRAKWNATSSDLDFNVDTSRTTSYAERLLWLTKSQLEIIVVAVSYCVQSSECSFNSRQLMDFAKRTDKLGENFDLSSENAMKNLMFLNNIGLLSPHRPGNALLELTQYTQFTLNLTASDLSLAMSEERSLTDRAGLFWKALK